MDSWGVRLTWFDCKSVLGRHPAKAPRRTREKTSGTQGIQRSEQSEQWRNGWRRGAGGGGGWGDVCTQATQWAIEEFRFKSLHSSFCLQFGDWIL